jgi:predicted RNase H-like nuclease (RuvC/YqgF family)
MKSFVIALFLTFGLPGHASAVNPIQKVIEMISSLQAKVIGEGEDTHKLYEKFAEMCEDRSRELHFNIKTADGEIADLKATIESASAEVQALGSKIEKLAGGIAESEAELKKATEVRDKEAADFAVEDKELVETISTIERATAIIEREMQKGGSFAQLHGAAGLQTALASLVQGLAISTADAGRLTALVQSSANDEDTGAPDAAVYESQSGGIVDALEGLLSKAEDQLAEVRKEEATSRNNFDLL